MSLRNKTVNGVIWNGLKSLGTKTIQLVITIVIARILTPEDYGLIGLLFVFIALGNILLDSGFGQALIRKKNPTNIDYSSIFYLNLIIGVVLYACCYFLSSSIAKFYEQPQLMDIARVYFLVFPLSSLAVVHNAILLKGVKFKKIAIVSLLSTVVSGICGIWMAYSGFGVWALVYQSLLQAFLTSVFYWVAHRWRPMLKFSTKPILELSGFSLNLLTTNIIIVLFNNAYTILIGKFYSIDKVGYYNQANRLQELPSHTLTSVIQQVTYSILTELQDNIQGLKQGYRRVISMTMFVNFPIMLCMIPLAHDLFLFFLGEQWLPAVPYFQILCVYGAFYPLQSINNNILKVTDNTKLLLRLEIIRRAILVAAIVLTLHRGITILLIGHVVASLIVIVINMIACGNKVNLSLKEQVSDIFPSFLLSVSISGVIFLALPLMEVNSVLKIIFSIAFAIIMYFFASSSLRIKAVGELRNIINSQLKKRK